MNTKATSALLLLLIAQFTAAQSRWTIYLGADMASQYLATTVRDTFDNSVQHSVFSAYDIFMHRLQADEEMDKDGRAGIILTAKATTEHLQKGEISFGNSSHLSIINYVQTAQVIRRGRSAALSVANLFSKKKDKEPQDEPAYEVSNRSLTGSILLGGISYPYSYSRTSNWLVMNSDTLRIVQASLYRNRKNGKIKKRNNSYEALQLMKNDQCVAAIDYNESPSVFYIQKNASEAEQLLFASFFLIRSLEVPLPFD